MGSDEEDGLDLEGVSLNYYSHHEKDGPTTFELFGDRLTIEPGQIKSLVFDDAGASGKYDIDEETIVFTFDLDDFKRLTLSDDAEFYNYIVVRLENAQAAEEGVRLGLWVDDTEKASAVIPNGGNYTELAFPGLVLEPDDDLEIKVSGSILVHASSPSLIFTPVDLELVSVTFDATGLDRILEDFDSEIFNISLDFPPDADIFELQLKEAKIAFTPLDIPEGFQIDVVLKIEALDQTGALLEDRTMSFSLINDTFVEFENLKDNLNQILLNEEIRTAKILLKVDPTVAAGQDVTLTYPGEITLEQDFAIVLDYITYASSVDGPEGSVEVPEELPLEIKASDIFFKLENNSPVALTVEVWLSPNPINREQPDADPEAVKNLLHIAANKEETSVLKLDPDEFTRLVESKTIYHLITFVNDSEGQGQIEKDDYLKITSWAKVTCTVNKREGR